MNEQPAKRDQYYTKDHERIHFKGTVAFIGICGFKLTCFKQIQEIKFNEPSGFKKQGEVVATIRHNGYLIEVHMPVDGKVLEINEKSISGKPQYTIGLFGIQRLDSFNSTLLLPRQK